MKDNIGAVATTGAASEVETLFEGLRKYLRKEAEKPFPALATPDEGTGQFREGSLERLYFARQTGGIIPRGSIAVLPDRGGPQS